MHIEEVCSYVGNIPYMTPERGRVIYQHIREQKPLQVLELGIGHGVGSCYMAAALHENSSGHLTCVDLESVTFSPSAEELISRVSLSDYVSISREKTSYTWFLKKLIEKCTDSGNICEPLFDLCYIDGPKNWTIDGAAFFMVDKLLKPEGWIIFDDYDWTYDSVAKQKPVMDGITIRTLSEDERTQPHIEAIFRLLVTQHPNYGEFLIDGNTWAWARKIHTDDHKLLLTSKPDIRYIISTRLRALYRSYRHHVRKQ